MKIELNMKERSVYETDKGYRFLVLYTNQFGAIIAPLRQSRYYHIDDIMIGEDEAVAIDQIAIHEYKWFQKVGWKHLYEVGNCEYEKIAGSVHRLITGQTRNMPGIGLCYQEEAEEVANRVVKQMPVEALRISKRYFDLLKGCDLNDREGRSYPRRKMFSGAETAGIAMQTVAEIVEKYDVDPITADIMITNAKNIMQSEI